MSTNHAEAAPAAARRGFARTLVFGALAAAGVPAVQLLVAPLLGVGSALALYLAGLAVAYLAWIAQTPRRAVGVGLVAGVAAGVVLLLAPSLAAAALGAALVVALGRSGMLYRGAQPRLVLLEAVLGVLGLGAAQLLAAPGVLGVALAVWSYFAVQSAFFLLARAHSRRPEPSGDAFERARERLEQLLAEV